MPRERTLFYRLAGPVTQDIYSEEEMAHALDLTVDELRRHLDPHTYGAPQGERYRYSYHAHPFATGGEFLFHRLAYLGNIQKYHRRRYLQDRGMWDEVSARFLYDVDVADTPENRLWRDGEILDTEEAFLAALAAYRAALERRDVEYHWSIREYYRHHGQ